jgi:hypothetical protein
MGVKRLEYYMAKRNYNSNQQKNERTQPLI